MADWRGGIRSFDRPSRWLAAAASLGSELKVQRSSWMMFWWETFSSGIGIWPLDHDCPDWLMRKNWDAIRLDVDSVVSWWRSDGCCFWLCWRVIWFDLFVCLFSVAAEDPVGAAGALHAGRWLASGSRDSRQWIRPPGSALPLIIRRDLHFQLGGWREGGASWPLALLVSLLDRSTVALASIPGSRHCPPLYYQLSIYLITYWIIHLCICLLVIWILFLARSNIFWSDCGIESVGSGIGFDARSVDVSPPSFQFETSNSVSVRFWFGFDSVLVSSAVWFHPNPSSDLIDSVPLLSDVLFELRPQFDLASSLFIPPLLSTDLIWLWLQLPVSIYTHIEINTIRCCVYLFM